MSLLTMAAQLFISKLGGSGAQLEEGGVVNALQQLLPTEGGELDLGALVAQFTSGGGLASLASSWLGSGENAELSPSSILDVLGSGPVADFAGKLGLEPDTAADGLAQMIPDLIDSNSEGGALTGAAGEMAKGLLGKLF